MLGLRKKYPVLNTLVSFVESSKEESSSVSKTHSSTQPHSPLPNTKVTAFINVMMMTLYWNLTNTWLNIANNIVNYSIRSPLYYLVNGAIPLQTFNPTYISFVINICFITYINLLSHVYWIYDVQTTLI